MRQEVETEVDVRTVGGCIRKRADEGDDDDAGATGRCGRVERATGELQCVDIRMRLSVALERDELGEDRVERRGVEQLGRRAVRVPNRGGDDGGSAEVLFEVDDRIGGVKDLARGRDGGHPNGERGGSLIAVACFDGGNSVGEVLGGGGRHDGHGTKGASAIRTECGNVVGAAATRLAGLRHAALEAVHT